MMVCHCAKLSLQVSLEKCDLLEGLYKKMTTCQLVIVAHVSATYVVSAKTVSLEVMIVFSLM